MASFTWLDTAGRHTWTLSLDGKLVCWFLSVSARRPDALILSECRSTGSTVSYAYSEQDAENILTGMGYTPVADTSAYL